MNDNDRLISLLMRCFSIPHTRVQAKEMALFLDIFGWPLEAGSSMRDIARVQVMAGEVSRPEWAEKTDWPMLQNQKLGLLWLIDKLEEEDKSVLSGIVNFLDVIQDYAEDELGFSVFEHDEEE